MVVVRCRVSRGTNARTPYVKNVRREHLVERDIIPDHADDRRGVIVERRKRRLVAVGPRRDEVLQCHVVE